MNARRLCVTTALAFTAASSRYPLRHAALSALRGVASELPPVAGTIIRTPHAVIKAAGPSLVCFGYKLFSLTTIV